MNPQTVAVLIVLAALLFLALRALKRGTDKGHCAGCNEQGCSGHPQDGACPASSVPARSTPFVLVRKSRATASMRLRQPCGNIYVSK